MGGEVGSEFGEVRRPRLDLFGLLTAREELDRSQDSELGPADRRIEPVGQISLERRVRRQAACHLARRHLRGQRSEIVGGGRRSLDVGTIRTRQDRVRVAGAASWLGQLVDEGARLVGAGRLGVRAGHDRDRLVTLRFGVGEQLSRGSPPLRRSVGSGARFPTVSPGSLPR